MRLSVVVIALGGVCLAVAAGVVAVRANSTDDTVIAPARATVGTTVAALGRIQPRSEIISLGGASTDVLTDLTVGRGSPVHAGDVLGHFRGFAEAAARERTAVQQLGEARAQRHNEEALGAARIAAAQAQLDGIAATGPARIEAQLASIRSIEGDLANNVDILNARQSLFQTEAGSRRLLMDQRALVTHQRADLDAARARLNELTQQFNSDKVNATASVAVERATASRAQSQIPVASLEQQVALAHAQVLGATLVSPIDGIVLNVLEHAGEAVGAGPILQLGDTTIMVAVAEVYETDVPRVHLGQRAVVTSPALAQPLRGKVVEVGRMVYKNDVLNVDPAARTDARVVEVRVALDDGTAVAQLTNMTVDVAIDTGAASDPEPPPTQSSSAVR